MIIAARGLLSHKKMAASIGNDNIDNGNVE
jgi:hypothetical protein